MTFLLLHLLLLLLLSLLYHYEKDKINQPFIHFMELKFSHQIRTRMHECDVTYICLKNFRYCYYLLLNVHYYSNFQLKNKTRNSLLNYNFIIGE